MPKQTIHLGRGGSSPPPPGFNGAPPPLPGGVAMTVQVCEACGVYAWMPLHIAQQVAQMHQGACLAPKIAALADHLDHIGERLLAITDRLAVHQHEPRGDEGDDESDEDAVTR